MKDKIILYSTGGCGDQSLSFRLTYLLNQIYPKIKVKNICCCREETWNMLNILYGDRFDITRMSENFLEGKNNLVNEMLLRELDEAKYIIWPDLLFRNKYSPPLKSWGISNFTVKQTRNLLGKWKPENRITVNLNSITPLYTYHSIPELVRELGKKFPDKEIYVPILTKWNQRDLNTYKFINLPPNVVIDINPEFSKSYDLLCRSEYLLTTDSGIMHIAQDLNLPYLTLDPQYKISMFSARWRPFAYYNSIPINSLVEDIVNIVNAHLLYPETQMIDVADIYRKDNLDIPRLLNFKD